jgi:hypothetical protein
MAQRTINNGEGGGAVRGKLNDNFSELYGRTSVSVAEFAGATDADKVAAATVASRQVVFGAGSYTLLTTPTITGSGTQLVAVPGAALSGAGAAALGFTSNAGLQRVQYNTSGSDFSAQYIRRNANHTGGTPGFVSGGLKVDTYVGAGVTNFEWAITGRVDNSATAGENVGVYGQGIRRGASVGATFGGVFEALDPTGDPDPVRSMVGLEVDCRGNGTDASNNRIGVDVVLNRQVVAGAAQDVAFGVRVQSGTDTGSTVKTAFGVVMRAEVGYDASSGTMLQAAFKMAQNQAFAFNSAATRQATYDGTGIRFGDGGSLLFRMNDDGTFQIGGNRVLTGRQSAVVAPVGGGTVDTQARTAINDLIARLVAHGLIAP